MRLLKSLESLGRRLRKPAPARAKQARRWIPKLEALEERTVPTVFGQYTRTLVTNTTAYPWRAVERIEVTYRDGAQFVGTAA